jgi:hypothetical protein
MLRKNHITKNQGWKPIRQKYKTNKNTSKQRTNDQQKLDEKPM